MAVDDPGGLAYTRNMVRFATSALILSLAASGCGDMASGDDAGTQDGGARSEPAVADMVVAAPGATGEGFGDPQRAVNGVRGGGDHVGGQDVYSLGLPPSENTSITLRWAGSRVQNGPGADLVVFENGFRLRGTDAFFMDLIIVEVSQDGENWRAFPHDYLAPDETAYSSNPEHWSGFAGRWPVLFHVDDNPVDPFWEERAGGDHFDLDDLEGSDALSESIRRDGFVYLRLVSAPARSNPDTGLAFPRTDISNGPDIDGVVARYLAAE